MAASHFNAMASYWGNNVGPYCGEEIFICGTETTNQTTKSKTSVHSGSSTDGSWGRVRESSPINEKAAMWLADQDQDQEKIDSEFLLQA